MIHLVVKQFYLIETGEHTTSEVYYFHKDEKIFNPKLFIKREQGILYSIDSFKAIGGCGQTKMRRF